MNKVANYEGGTVMVNDEACMVNADGAYVPIARIKRIDLLRDGFVTELVARARRYSAGLQEYKAEVLQEIDAFVELSAEEHGVKLRGRKGGFSLLSYNGLQKIVVDNETLITVNEKVSVARELVFSCLKRWTKGADANLAEVVRRAFEPDKAGHLSVAKLLSLRSYKIDDDEWLAAMEALTEGLTVYGSRTYVRFYARRTLADKWEQIPL